MRVLLFFESLKLLLVLMVIMIGKWSDDSWVFVSHEVLFARDEDMVVMSGDVACCSGFGGSRVGRPWLRMMWSDCWIVSAMISPLWSVRVDESHRCECALASPAMSEFWVVVSSVMSEVIDRSSLGWLVSVFLGGM